MADRVGSGLESNFDPDNLRQEEGTYPLSDPIVIGGLTFNSRDSSFTTGASTVSVDWSLDFGSIDQQQTYDTSQFSLHHDLVFNSFDQSENYVAAQYSLTQPLNFNGYEDSEAFGTTSVTLDYDISFNPLAPASEFGQTELVLLSYLDFNPLDEQQQFGQVSVASDVYLDFGSFDQSEDYTTGSMTVDWTVGFQSLANVVNYSQDTQLSLDWDLPVASHDEGQVFETAQFSLDYTLDYNSLASSVTTGQALIEKVYSVGEITSPLVNLTGNSVLVEWVPANPPQVHKLTVSSVEQGVLFQDNNLSAVTSSVQLEGLPINGETLTITLEFTDEDGVTPAYDVVTIDTVQVSLTKNSSGNYLVSSADKFSWSGLTSEPDSLTLFGETLTTTATDHRFPYSTFTVGDSGTTEVILSATYGTETYTVSETYDNAKEWIINLTGNTCYGTGLSVVWDTDTPHADTYQLTSDNNVDTGAEAYQDPGAGNYSRHILGIPVDGGSSTFTLTGTYNGESFVLSTGTITHGTVGNLLAFTIPTVSVRDDNELFTVVNQGNPTTNRVEIHDDDQLGGLLATGTEPAGSTLTVNNIPDTPATIYAFFFAEYPGSQEYSVNRSYVNERVNYQMLLPTNSDPLIGNNWEFTYSSDIEPVTWQIIIDGYYDTGTFTGSQGSYFFTNFPDDGGTYTVRLRGVDEYGDTREVSRIYQTYDVDAVPRITSPAAGSSLTTDSHTFIWDENNTDVTDFELDVGTTYGGTDYYDGSVVSLPASSQLITGFPIDGSAIYARLKFLLFGNPQEANYVYYAQYIKPHVDNNLTWIGSNTYGFPNPVHTFNWGPYGEPNITNYRLEVVSLGTNTHPDGTIVPAGTVLFDSGELNSVTQSASVNTAPIYGYLCDVILHWKVDGVWDSTSFYSYYNNNYVRTYDADPRVTTGATTVTEPQFNISWISDYVPVTGWALEVYQGLGTVGAPFYTESGIGAATLSGTILNIPTDGGYFTVKLAYTTSEGWSGSDLASFSTLGKPRLSGPTYYYSISPTTIFHWTPEGSAVTEWQLTLGSTIGGTDYYDSGTLPATTLSTSVSGLPTPGYVVYVTLNYVVDNINYTKNYSFNSYVAPPQITSPSNNSNISASGIQLNWTSGGNEVTTWRLTLGSTTGASDLLDTGELDDTILTTTVQSIPEYSTHAYATLFWSLNDGLTWSSASYYYRVQLQPVINIFVSGYYESSVNVSWNPKEVTVTSYDLYVSYTDNNEVVTNQTGILPTIGSFTFVGLANGRPVQATLTYRQDNGQGGQLSRTVSDTANLIPYDFPDILSPGTVAGNPSRLAGATQNVIWDAGNVSNILDELRLQVLRVSNGDVLYDSGILPATDRDHIVQGYPHDGSLLYILLTYDTTQHTLQGTQEVYLAPIAPEIVTPVQGTELSWDDTEFVWDDGDISVSSFELILTDNPNGHEVTFDPQDANAYYSSGEIQGNIRIVPIVPQGYATLYAFLIYESSGQRFYVSNTYSTGDLGFTSPTPDDESTAPVEAFLVKWIPSDVSDQYQLKIVIKDNPTVVLFDSGVTTATSVSIPKSVNRDGNTWLVQIIYTSRYAETYDLTLYTVATDIDFFPIPFTAWDSFVETFTYANYVNTYRNGTEHRYTASPSFVHQITASVPTTKDRMPTLLQTVKSFGEGETYIPLWNQSVACITKASPTVYTVSQSEGVLYKRLAPGQLVLLWNNENLYRVTTVVDRTSTTLTVLGAEGDYAEIVPIMSGYISYSRGGELHHEGNYHLGVSVELIQDKMDTTIAEEINGAYPTWFINDAVHYLPGSSQLSFNQLKYNITSKVLTVPIITGRKAQLTIAYSIALTTVKQISEFMYWLTQLRGIEGEFIQPLYSEIFKLVDVTTNYVDVETYNVYRPLDLSVVTHIVFVGREHKKISHIENHTTFYRVYFDSQIVNSVEACDVLFGVLGRMAQSDTTITWYDGKTAEVQVKVLEVLSEEQDVVPISEV